MKRKIAAVMLMVFAMPIFSLAMPKAEAASLGDQLAELSAANAQAAQIEELLKIKDNFEQGNKQALWGTLAQFALERTGKADIVNDISSVAAQLAAQDQDVAKENIARAVETAVRTSVQEKVQAEVNDRLAGYQDEVVLLSSLLTNTSNYLDTKRAQE
ncbi:3D domain containing protein (fragment) [uncultured Sporomusa sp.]|uniref:3D domain containing protein n=1 Tax=uncultured Sporomusa sp. TaxID=307249 RepID=A0A212LRQ4_9FIRM